MKPKTDKLKPAKKSVKKAAKKQLEQSLSEKFLEAIKSLGHNAEAMATEVAKASKRITKKIGKAIIGTKETAAKKIEEVATPKKIR